MDANTYSLKQILTHDRRYLVPTYQRDYEWTRDGQWELMFDDLEETSERLCQSRRHAELLGKPATSGDASVPPHFLGAIVCDQLAAPAGGLDLRAVIDGQQRLTTIQLILRGVLDVLLERGSPRAKQVRRLLENPADVAEAPEERHKLWPRRRDREVWPVAMADATPTTDDGHLYLQARRYFAERARRASVGAQGADRSAELVDALLDLFKLVVIDLDGADDAQVIFEVLNGRQTPLAAADLVKNLLFLRGELKDEKHLDKVYEEYWAPFDDPWWKAEVGRGHAQRGRRDVLLSSWLTAVARSETNIGHLYREVRTYLEVGKHETVEVLAELRDYGRAYRVVLGAEPAETEPLRTAYHRLDLLGITTALPLLMWLRTVPPERLPVSEHERAVRAVESWVVRRLLVGANTRGYGKVFVDVLKAANTALETPDGCVADAVETALVGNPDNLAWPTDHDLAAAFASNKIYGTMTQGRIRMVLGAIDRHLQAANPKTEPAAFEYDTLQIEHVMPQKWREHWDLAAGTEADSLLEAQQRDALIHRLGNLTLVTATFNQTASNAAWSVKRQAFTEQSKLQLNAPIADRSTWDIDAINERGRQLAALAACVWPRAAES